MKFIIRGLREHPFYTQAIVPRTIATHESIMALQKSLEKLGKPETHAHTLTNILLTPSVTTSNTGKFCAYHRTFGSYSTDECRTILKLAQKNRNTPNTLNNPKNRTPTSAIKKARQEKSHRANAASSDHSTEQRSSGDDDSYTSPDQVSSTYETYILDTGCFPSFCTKPISTSHKTDRLVRLPNGSFANISRELPATARTKQGQSLRIGALCHAPTFSNLLLSISDLTSHNDVCVTFHKTGGLITRTSNSGHSYTVATFGLEDGLYTIPLAVTRDEVSPIAHNANAFRKIKPMVSRPRVTLPNAKPKPLPQSPVSPKPLVRITTPKPKTVVHPGHQIVVPCDPVPLTPTEQRKLDIAHDWHLTMNHTSNEKLRKMAARDIAFQLPPEMAKGTVPIDCHGCAAGHMQKKGHKATVTRPPPGHTYVTDIGGELAKTPSGFKYYLTVTELHTRFSIAYVLKAKSEAEQALMTLIPLMERHFDKPATRIRSDNASEYLTKALHRNFGARATHLDPTIPHSPEENSVAERINRTLISRVRATLETAQMPFEIYWATCLLDTAVKYNSTLHDTYDEVPRALWNELQTPYSPFKSRPLSLKQFRPFGEFGHIPNLVQPKTKQSKRATLVRYLYSPEPDRYKVLDVSTGRIIVTRIIDYRPYNPQFDPQRRYSQAIPANQHFRPRVNMHHALPRFALAAEVLSRDDQITARDAPTSILEDAFPIAELSATSDQSLTSENAPSSTIANTKAERDTTDTANFNLAEVTMAKLNTTSAMTTAVADRNTKRKTQTPHNPVHCLAFHTVKEVEDQYPNDVDPIEPTTTSAGMILYKDDIPSLKEWMAREATATALSAQAQIIDPPCVDNGNLPIQLPKPPRGLHAARKHSHAEQWRSAYETEREAHRSFGTFQPVSKSCLEPGTKNHKLVMAFSYKYHKDGTLAGHKARFAFPGNRLIPDKHYDPEQTAAFTASKESVGLLMSLAVVYNLDLKHIDLKNAFLHEKYQGNVPLFVQPTLPFDDTTKDSDTVYRLVKNIYGTPQATRVYTKRAYKLLQAAGYTQLKEDINVFFEITGDSFIIIALTIDDFIVTYSHEHMYDEILRVLRSKYRVKDLGHASNVLGWTVVRNREDGHLHISQRRLCTELLAALNMTHITLSQTPYISLKKKTTEADEQDLEEYLHKFYRKAVGILRYLVNSSRPNLAFVTSNLARFVAQPKQSHWKELKTVAKYVVGTKDWDSSTVNAQIRCSDKVTRIMETVIAPDDLQKHSSFSTVSISFPGPAKEFN